MEVVVVTVAHEGRPDMSFRMSNEENSEPSDLCYLSKKKQNSPCSIPSMLIRVSVTKRVGFSSSIGICRGLAIGRLGCWIGSRSTNSGSSSRATLLRSAIKSDNKR